MFEFVYVGVTNCGDLNVDTFVDAEPIKYTRDKMTSVQSGLSLLTKSVNAGNASHLVNNNMMDR